MKPRFTILILVLFLISCIHLHGQYYKQRSFGVGMGASGVSVSTPSFGATPYVFFTTKNHEFLAGPKIYPPRIIGAEAEYRYHCLNFSPHFTSYLIADFQYVRYAYGAIGALPFNYHKSLGNGFDYSMYRYQSFDNTAGAAIQWNSKRGNFAIYAEGGADYNYTITTYSPYNVNQVGTNFSPDKKFEWGFMVKWGVSLKLWKEKPQRRHGCLLDVDY